MQSFKRKQSNTTFLWCCLLYFIRWLQKCDHSNKSYRARLSRDDVVYYDLQVLFFGVCEWNPLNVTVLSSGDDHSKKLFHKTDFD